MILHVFHAGEYETGFEFIRFVGVAGFGDKRHFMTGIHKAKLPCHKIQYSFKGGDEQPLAVGFAQQIIDLGEDLSQIPAGLCVILDQCLADHHKERGGNAFSRHIGNHDSEMGLIHHKEIIKVAAHFFGRIHGRVNIKFRALRESRENTGQHVALNPGCHIQLRGDTLMLLAVPDLLFKQPSGS